MTDNHRPAGAQVSVSLHCASQIDMMPQLTELEQLGFNWYHIDITDGVFAPNYALGSSMVLELRRFTSKPIYVHLMTVKPEEQVRPFLEAGVDGVSFHLETTHLPFRLVRSIHGHGTKAGVVLAPITPVEALGELIHVVDLVTIMSIEPGYSGQSFMQFSYEKIRQLRAMLNKAESDALIEVDGGVDNSIAEECMRCGADCIVAGLYTVFDSRASLTENYHALMKALR